MLNSDINAPNQSSIRQTSEAYDADLHASNLTNWQQAYDQMSRGAFYGRIVESSFDGLQVFCEHTSQALQQKCVVWPDSIWLGIPLAEQTSSRINGLSVRQNDIMCRPGDCEFQLSTPEDYDLYGLVVETAKLMKVAKIHGLDLNWQELNENGRLKIPDKTLSEVRFLLGRLLSTNYHGTSPRLQQDIVIMALLELLRVEQPQPAKTQSYAHRKKVVDCAQQFLANHLEEAVTVTQLCEVTNVSRRTLQYSFESILGISPIQYLRLSRLNGVRRTLVYAQRNQSVGDIAAQWGFWHMSQFAKDYKHLFGEQPSQTLEWRKGMHE
ncbi:helix-turn-helix domain-containing protein [Marinomonas sp. C2222]|uniref:Helix-turn-helix domain-containing protein n=1 Tax=Marinomonas sargassi TaxID=2984494 RepID=A0ABT2YPT6_9GAMM|nr:helix-turn-helix domain-containing protein [Marinomonas sargassi]MCV2401904.1 helix-turn-helix domain-containing protein [Marinomonas sargassi]